MDGASPHHPYFFQSNMPETEKPTIRGAMDIIEANSCLTFSECQETNCHQHHLEIFSKNNPCQNRNHGEVNKLGLKLTLHFDNTLECGNFTNLTIHELCHVLGLAHTQKRWDRNSSIKVNKECISEDKHTQYKPLLEEEIDTLKILYKCNSMMHYASSNSNDCETMTAVSDECKRDGIGGIDSGPIKEDWKLINLAHNCPTF